MKNFKLKEGVKVGSMRMHPRLGLVALTPDLSDVLVEELIAAGIDAFEKSKTPNGKESIESEITGKRSGKSKQSEE
ncbi:hypothetical protein LAG90_15705 [Marinilongibacter aquaticus]|uniref:hypothetical protein n=1 Tax=Marinilongibacter aquaticus TaxID=2975157 RepID=UPI0021BD57B0|nr:hypothetical protein [Marinilongibacter aquaticus]UBM58249.1 hypothetical protein LAG90_15705 [Marinilongibacter aquaticus]